MTVFRATAESIGVFALDGSLGLRIAENLRMTTGTRPSQAEERSWVRSLPVLSRDLVEAGLGSVEMLVEYRVPLSSKRVDVVLAGTRPDTGDDQFVVVELKQWSAAQSFEGDENLVLVDGVRGGPRTHPGLQVEAYCEYIEDFLGILDGEHSPVLGMAYLHNAVDQSVQDLYRLPQEPRRHLFTGARRSELLTFLRQNLSGDDAPAAADRFLTSAVRPSRQLLAVAAEEVKNREQFTLIAEQRLAYELVLHAVANARSADSKEVVVVTGGPGSGKSVIALSLLGELSRQGRSAMHATGSSSFTQTMRTYVGKGSTRIKKLFAYFNSFMQAESNSLDVLICDEAHRIRTTSVNRWTRAEHRSDRPQVDELIAVARVPVFLLDQHQVVKPGEIGTVDEIREGARRRGLRVHEVNLDGQFRAGGSALYEQWVLQLLGLAEAGPQPWAGDERFTLELAESPWELEAILQAKRDTGDSARIAAGYCWSWSDPRPDQSLVPDVQVGDWARPWNVKSDRAVGDAPGRALWATDPRGFGQVGCVYTAQGFEYDWSGVIVGPDLVARNGELVSVRSANRDPSFKNRNTVSDADFDRLVRHVYKVLLTRGMKGTVLYATDPQTRRFLAELLSQRSAAAVPATVPSSRT